MLVNDPGVHSTSTVVVEEIDDIDVVVDDVDVVVLVEEGQSHVTVRCIDRAGLVS